MRAKSSLAAAGSAAVSSTRETSKDRGRGSSDSSLSFHMAFKNASTSFGITESLRPTVLED